jgi:hypothetical protein
VWRENVFAVTPIWSQKDCTRVILGAGTLLFCRLLYWHGTLHLSKCVFHRNVDRDTRSDEQFNALMHGVHLHRCVYWDSPLALGQRSKAIGSTLYVTMGVQGALKTYYLLTFKIAY